MPDGLLGDYLALWGLGGIFGKTIVIDMAYTRRHEVVRAHVRVTDISCIPYHKIIMYNDEGYKISIEFEGIDEEVLMAAADGHDEDTGHDGDADKQPRKDLDAQADNNNKSNPGGQNNGSKAQTLGVIIPPSVTHTLYLQPHIRFGAFSDRWSDLVEE